MKRIFSLLVLVFVLVFGCVGGASAEFPERPVGLAVLDYGRNVDSAFYKQIYAPVKWAYHFPYYKINDNEELTAKIADSVTRDAKLTPELMGQLCKDNKLDVLVLAKIYETSEVLVPSMGGWRHGGSEVYTRVTCWADLYCYRADKQKLLKKRLRERFLADGPNYERPQETVKWQLSKLVNTMEGRPIIGADE